MSEKTKKPGFGLKEAEVRSAEQGRQNDRKKHRKKLERSFRKDFLYYDIFSQLWGWDEYNGNSDPEKAIQRLRQAMQNQQDLDIRCKRPLNGDLQFQVGVAYLNGWLPCKNSLEEAWRWFRRSEKRGSPRGKMAIGYMHEKQLIAKHDEIAMLSNYTSAAAEGYAPAQYRLALYYQKQSNPDREQIKDLLTDAAAQEHTPAKYLLAELYPETVYNMEYREIYGYEWAELARKQKESSTGLYAPKEEQDDDNNLADLMKETHDNVKRILPIVPVVIDNNEILRRVEISVQMLQSSLNTMWTELRQDNAKAAEKWKQLMDRDLQKAASPQWASDTYLAKEDAEAFMSVLFKGDWREPGRLCDASCDALVTAYVLMKMADKLALSNYSGIVITAVWALEHECRRRFRDAFEKHLASLKVPEEEMASRMNLKSDKDGNIEFTLGSTYYVVNPFKLENVWQFTKPSEFDSFAKTCDFLSTTAKEVQKRRHYPDAGMVFWDYWIPGTEKSGKKNTKVTGQSFTQILYTLNKNYRIPAAHAMEVGRKEAEVCCDLLGITEAHKKMDNITGALKALLWLTAPLE